jgi:hypothetical protein
MNVSPFFIVLTIFDKGNVKRSILIAYRFKMSIISRITAKIKALTFISDNPGTPEGFILIRSFSAKEAKLNPYVVSRSAALARKITYKDLEQYVDDLYQIDIASKTINIDIEEALQNYILKLGF